MASNRQGLLLTCFIALIGPAIACGGGSGGAPFQGQTPNITDAALATGEDVQIARRLVEMNGRDAEEETSGSVSSLRTLRTSNAARSASITQSCADLERYGNVWNGSGSITVSGSYDDETTDLTLNMSFNQCRYEGLFEEGDESCNLAFSINGSYRCTTTANRFPQVGMHCATPSPCSGLTIRLGDRTATVGEDLVIYPPTGNSDNYRTTGTICVNGTLFDVEDLMALEPAETAEPSDFCGDSGPAEEDVSGQPSENPAASLQIDIGRLTSGLISVSYPVEIYGPTLASRQNAFLEIMKNRTTQLARVRHSSSFERDGTASYHLSQVAAGDQLDFVVHLQSGETVTYSGRVSASQNTVAVVAD